MKCPLCNYNDIIKIDTIDKNSLVELYKKFTKVDFSYLLKQNINFYECQVCRLRFYYPVIIGDEKFYNSLQKFDWYYMNDKQEYRFAKEFIKESDKVLEIGSGKGAFSRYIPTKAYIGLDVSKKAKRLAEENGITILNETIQEYSSKHKGEFDVVCCFQVLEHIGDPKRFIKASLNTLKSGGKLIVGVPSDDSFLKYVTNDILNMPPHHVTRWSDRTLKFIAQHFDLDLITIFHEKVQPYHKRLYINTLFQSLLFNKMRLLDYSFKFRIMNLLTSFFTAITYKRIKDEFLPYGHTVVAVFRKRCNIKAI